MGIVRLVLLGGGVLVGLVAAVAAIAWLGDYGVEATVTGKSTPCGLGSNYVEIETDLLGIGYRVEGLPYQQCLAVNSGNYVVYHLRSSRVSLYQSEGGACIYDSVGGVAGCSA